VVLRLSPYCVFYPDPDGSHVILIHSLYGSKFRLSAEMFQILAAFLPGCAVERGDANDPASGAIQDLIEEKVLIGSANSPNSEAKSSWIAPSARSNSRY
jgi:hypothetical protein